MPRDPEGRPRSATRRNGRSARALTPLILLLGVLVASRSVHAQETFQINFDGTGAENGITEQGTTEFSIFGSDWSGGTVMTVGVPSFYASGSSAYHMSGTATVAFDEAVDSATFFFVHGGFEGPFTATAKDMGGGTLEMVSSLESTNFGDPANFVTLDPGADIASVEFSGGHIDNFSFTTIGGKEPPEELEIVAGDRVNATLAAGGSQEISLDLPAGTLLTLRAKRGKGSGAMPGLCLLDPDDQELVSAEDSALNDNAARIMMVVAETGTYSVELVDRGTAGGLVRMKSKAKPAKLGKEVVAVEPVPPVPPPGDGMDDDVITLQVVEGTVLRKLVVKRLAPKGAFAEIGGQPSDLQPGIESVSEQGGGEDLDLTDLVTPNAKGTRVLLKDLTFDDTGVFDVKVEGVDGSVGFGRASVKLIHPKGKQLHVVP